MNIMKRCRYCAKRQPVVATIPEVVRLPVASRMSTRLAAA